MTPEQMAYRRLGRAHVINVVACPVCAAAVGVHCVGTRHPVRLSPHLQRILAAKKPRP